MMQERVAKHGSELRSKTEFFVPESMNQFNHADVPNLYQKFTAIFLLLLVWEKIASKHGTFIQLPCQLDIKLLMACSICLGCRRS